MTRISRAGDLFRFRALRPVAAGEQVTISYGPHSDAQLLCTFGFVPDGGGAGGGGRHEGDGRGGRGRGSGSGRSLRDSDAPPASPDWVSQPWWNPRNTVTIPVDVVLDWLHEWGGELVDEKLAHLRNMGVLPFSGTPGAGFTLAMSEEGVAKRLWGALAATSASSAAPLRGAALDALIPPALLTVLQLGALSDDDLDGRGDPIREYVESHPFFGDVPAPTTLLKRLAVAEAEYARATDSHDQLYVAPGTAPVYAAFLDGGSHVASDGGGADAASDGGGSGDQWDAPDETAVLDTWCAVAAVLAAALRAYPSSLEADLQWQADVTAMQRRAHGDSSGAERSGKRQRVDAPSSSSSSSYPSSSSGAAAAVAEAEDEELDDDESDPWAWPHERQVARGVRDRVYRSCRLLALREKQLLACVLGAVDSELRLAQAAIPEPADPWGDYDSDSEKYVPWLARWRPEPPPPRPRWRLYGGTGAQPLGVRGSETDDSREGGF